MPVGHLFNLCARLVHIFSLVDRMCSLNRAPANILLLVMISCSIGWSVDRTVERAHICNTHQKFPCHFSFKKNTDKYTVNHRRVIFLRVLTTKLNKSVINKVKTLMSDFVN